MLRMSKYIKDAIELRNIIISERWWRFCKLFPYISVPLICAVHRRLLHVNVIGLSGEGLSLSKS